MKVNHLGGDRFEISIRDHSVIVDQPIPNGGEDTGPTPTELFVASIASCGAFYGRRFLARHGLPDNLTVDAQWSTATQPSRIARVDLKVNAPQLPLAMRERLRRVVLGCMVHNTLRNHPEIEIEIAQSADDIADAEG